MLPCTNPFIICSCTIIFFGKTLPADPHKVYRGQGWMGWPDWFGITTQSWKRWKDFREARTFVQRLKLKSNTEWRKYSRGDYFKKDSRPPDIPCQPDVVYKNQGWKSWGDWLGTGYVAHELRNYKSYSKAKSFVKKLQLQSYQEWRQYSKKGLLGKPKKPADMPITPEKSYKLKGWKSWGDWLGTGFVAHELRKYRSFIKARAFVKKLRLKSYQEWRQYCTKGLPGKPKKPADVPTTPEKSYKYKGWKSWGDWLGTGFVAHELRKYRSFIKARSFVKKLRLKSYQEWRQYCKKGLSGRPKKPADVPITPEKSYKLKGWKGYKDWLGILTP